jgi:hypothetical protein
MSQPSSTSGTAATQPPAAPAGLPDLNSGKYTFDQVLNQLKRATSDFHFFAIPQRRHSKLSDVKDPYLVNGGFALNIESGLHRVNAVVQEPSPTAGLPVDLSVGESQGKFKCRMTIAPDDFPWSPGKEPPAILFDRYRGQRFVLLDNEFSFEDDQEGFSGYGVGRTYTNTSHGRPTLLAGAIGNIVSGSGRFKGLEGTYALNGAITENFGFVGDITLRVLDWSGTLRTESDLPGLTAISNPDDMATHIVMRGQKKDPHVKSGYAFAPNGELRGITAPAEFRSAEYDFSASRHRGLRSHVSVGQVIGKLEATIITNLAAPATAETPAPFMTEELYTFWDSQGRVIGTIKAGVAEGDSFNLVFPALPGQPGLRFAGYGPATEGTGAFAGVQGLCTVNSLIGISPHALSLIHTFRLIRP